MFCISFCCRFADDFGIKIKDKEWSCSDGFLTRFCHCHNLHSRKNSQVKLLTVHPLQNGKSLCWSLYFNNTSLMTSTMLMRPASTTRDLMTIHMHLMVRECMGQSTTTQRTNLVWCCVPTWLEQTNHPLVIGKVKYPSALKKKGVTLQQLKVNYYGLWKYHCSLEPPVGSPDCKMFPQGRFYCECTKPTRTWTSIWSKPLGQHPESTANLCPIWAVCYCRWQHWYQWRPNWGWNHWEGACCDHWQ